MDILIPILIGANADKIIIDESIKLILSKSKKTKTTKFKKLAKLKNLLNLSKSLNVDNNVGITEFLTFKARLTFILFGHALTEATIFQYFDLKYFIQIKTNISSYFIDRTLSQVISNQVTLDYLTLKAK